MPFLALDLEMNQPSGKIIEIGVCVGRASQHFLDYEIKQWFIDPCEDISDYITDLTGISNEMIKEQSSSLTEVATELSGLIEKHKPFINPVTWGGGDSAALLQLFQSNDIDFPYFGRRWIDVKTIHVFDCITENKDQRGGLSSVMKKYKLDFVGTKHRAAADATNTLRLFFEMMENRKQALLTGDIA